MADALLIAYHYITSNFTKGHTHDAGKRQILEDPDNVFGSYRLNRSVKK